VSDWPENRRRQSLRAERSNLPPMWEIASSHPSAPLHSAQDAPRNDFASAVAQDGILRYLLNSGHFSSLPCSAFCVMIGVDEQITPVERKKTRLLTCF
jgi:hypothetical protein